METILIILVLVLLFGGGGGYYWSRGSLNAQVRGGCHDSDVRD